ncbi:hypothetical protein K1T71_004649 [Dendrolimus kikuchii]|uniref:Uncharacterized protein n=1 Tax=Dendrolimus kikuchii TaxID=765133 RepID=A0ACC1D8Z2_9NEOP|nr:hypothetical protein K1T71_004649 [Dendrolimus kikuchii]
MSSFVKLIFILVFCFKFVVSEPYAPVGQRQRANNTHDWPAGENLGGTSDRHYQNLNMQPRENSLRDYGSHQETTNLLHQQRNNRNIEKNDNQELRHQQPLTSRNEGFRNDRNRKNPSWQRNDFDMLTSRPGRNLETPSDQMSSELINRNSGNNNNNKPSNSDRRQLRFDRNFETLNYENDTPVNIMDIGKTLNKYKRANEREENSARILQANPSRIRDETYNLPSALSSRGNYKTQHNTPLGKDDEIFDSENEKQYKSRRKVQQSFSRLSHKIEPDTTNTRNYNIEEERLFGVSNRPLLNDEELIQRNQAKRQLDSLNKGNRASQSDQDFNNEYRTPVRTATPISYDGDNTKSDYTIPRNKQERRLETSNTPKVQVQEVRRPLEISEYDNSDYGPPIQQKHHTKSILYNDENSDGTNLNSGYTAHKMSPTQSYVTSDLSRVNENNGHRFLQKEQKIQNNPSKPADRITILNEPSNLSEENLSDKYYSDISSSYDIGSSNSGTLSLISERSENRNIETSSVERLNDNSRNIKRITTAHPVISESDDRGSSDVEEETLNQSYNRRQDIRPKINKMSTTVKDSNSESPVYLDYSNEYSRNSQNGHFSSKLSNNKVLNNGSGRKIEIDINYLQSPKYDSSEKDHILDSVESKLIIDEKPTKLLTTFTQGEDGIDLKIENDNFEVPAAVPPLIKLINRKVGQRNFDDKTIDTNQEGRSSNFKKKEKSQNHVIPIILNNDNEKRTFNLNENVPLTVDFSGPIEEIDINYHIGEEVPIIKSPREHTEKSKKMTVTRRDFLSGDASNGEQETDKNDAKELIKSTKNSQSKTEIGQKSSGHKKNVKRDSVSDHPVVKNTSNRDTKPKTLVQDTKIDSQKFKENVKGVTTSKIYDGPVSETSSSASTNTNSGKGITSLFSDFLNLFSNLGSSEDTVAKSDQAASNERKIHKKRGHLHRPGSHKHRVRSDLGDDEIITLSPIEVPQQPTYNDSLINENDSTSKVGSISKRGHSHGKKKTHRRSGSDSNINQENLPVPDQNTARASDARDNQEIRHIRKGSLQKQPSGSNSDNDEIVTLSPIEVPQEPTKDMPMQTGGPINKRGPRRIKKTKRRRSDGGDTHDQENLQRNDQYDARDNRDFDFSRIVAKSKPVVWYPGNGDEFANVKDERNVPNVMYMFQIENRPIVERDTKTTILSNGTMIKEYTEITYKDKEDKEPTIFRTTKVIHPDEPIDEYPF